MVKIGKIVGVFIITVIAIAVDIGLGFAEVAYIKNAYVCGAVALLGGMCVGFIYFYYVYKLLRS